ncbi:Late embryogenesis abundant protein [Quillaja saponaria]|uniref:Late embryogenesis abundant protein n=1 Tax=Quillaja saponaria TaxID=32244 RepID=A0AAD7LST0_QUISA|nr:Late embryogenesis abundant protein [Quillaja saponaria]
MLALPPPPPPPPVTPTQQTKPVTLDQIVISSSREASKNQHSLRSETRGSITKKISQPPILQPHPRRTNPIIWCAAVLCLMFSLILIFFGIATLIIFLAIKPRNPIVDIPNASLNTIYFDSPEYFNGDFALLANFSNPNRKIDLRFEYLSIDLFFSNKLISSLRAVQPFTQRRGEIRLESVHFISSLVFLPQDLAVKLQKQVQSNRVNYYLRGTFRVRANLGLFHMSYWLHSRCQLVMTGPPAGVLVARRCITKR